MTATQFQAGEVVRGMVAGTFLVLGHRSIGGEAGYQLKAVETNANGEVIFKHRGELFLPADAVKAF